jgi:hypothetical protein
VLVIQGRSLLKSLLSLVIVASVSILTHKNYNLSKSSINSNPSVLEFNPVPVIALILEHIRRSKYFMCSLIWKRKWLEWPYQLFTINWLDKIVNSQVSLRKQKFKNHFISFYIVSYSKFAIVHIERLDNFMNSRSLYHETWRRFSSFASTWIDWMIIIYHKNTLLNRS